MKYEIELSPEERARIIDQVGFLLRQSGETDPAIPGLSTETGEALHKIWLALGMEPHWRIITERAKRRLNPPATEQEIRALAAEIGVPVFEVGLMTDCGYLKL